MIKNTLFLLLLLCGLHTFSQSESDIITIRTFVEQTNLHLKEFNVSNLENKEANSTEGNETLVFTEELDKIRMIKETYFGEMGKTVIWNYITNNHPVFVFKEYFTYKLPITDKKFNANDFTKTEERFYIKNDRIIRWMKDKKILKTYPSNAASIETNMVEHIESLIAAFQKENKE